MTVRVGREIGEEVLNPPNSASSSCTELPPVRVLETDPLLPRFGVEAGTSEVEERPLPMEEDALTRCFTTRV
jgi:hypothetical protein